VARAAMSDSGYLHPITGSFSIPAGGNPTGVLMQAAFDAAGMRAQYVNCEVTPEGLRAAVAGARAMGWTGFNCSMPHKVAVMGHLDRIGTSADAIGAVNCVRRDGERLIGENTDGRGFVRSLLPVSAIEGRRFVVLGAGGAARAIAVELGLAGAGGVTVLSRRADAGEAVAAAVRSASPAVEAEAVAWSPGVRIDPAADVVVNATDVGMDGRSAPEVDLGALRPGTVVGDVVIAAEPTPFLREAERRGLIILDGLGMLVEQAMLSLEYWFGMEPDAPAMRSALQEALRGS